MFRVQGGGQCHVCRDGQCHVCRDEQCHDSRDGQCQMQERSGISMTIVQVVYLIYFLNSLWSYKLLDCVEERLYVGAGGH